MAGGKETPRQKLIGLMYLVLLALLALQVSSAIMEKFYFLDKSLEASTSEALIRNKGEIEKIKAKVAERPNDADKLTLANNIRKQTESVLSFIASVRKELVESTEGLEESGMYKGAKEESKIEEYFIGNKKGEELRKMLDGYLAMLKKEAPKGVTANFAPLTRDANDDPLYKSDPDQRGKDWVELNFAHTPMVAAMAVLSDISNKVAGYEALILADIAGQIGAKTFKFDEIFADYKAESKYVAAGTEYNASIYITGRNSKLIPVIKFDGRPVEVKDGVGVIKFKTSGGTYDKDGNLKKTWTGSVTTGKPTGGGDTTFTVKGEYVVVKPVLDIKADAVSALYVGCANDLLITCPALGVIYDPSFKITNADFNKGAAKGQVTVYPRTKGKVKIDVSSAGSFIDFKEFDVKDIPLPVLKFVKGGGDANPLGEKSTLSSIKVAVEPDKGFQEALPKEAQYNIEEGNVVVARGKTFVKKIALAGNGLIRLTDLNINAGDNVQVQIVKLVRVNSRGEKSTVSLPTSRQYINQRFVD